MKTFFDKKLYKYNALIKFLFFKKVHKFYNMYPFAILMRNDKHSLNTLAPLLNVFNCKYKIDRKFINRLNLPRYYANANVYRIANLKIFIELE